MTSRPRLRVVHRSRTARRDEVAAVLARQGLDRPADDHRAWAATAERWRACCGELGPVFVAFNRYLARRPDLLPVEVCRRLAQPLAPPRAMGAWPSGEELRDHLAAELGHPLAAVLSWLDPEPVERSSFELTLAGRLLSGEPVWLRLVHPQAAVRLAEDVPLLSLLAPAFAALGGPVGDLPVAVESFAAAAEQALDRRQTAEACELLSEEAAELRGLGAPRVYRPLCTARLLVQEPAARPLAAHLAETRSAGDAAELARRLAEAFFRQALGGGVLPSELDEGSLALGPAGEVLWLGGSFYKPSAAGQRQLRRYLTAAARQDPEERCALLLRELVPLAAGAAPDEVLHRLRQAVPFRDGGWGDGDGSLSETLFLEWRLARHEGFALKAPMQAFAAACCGLELLCRELAPGSDPLQRALEDTLLATSLDHLAEMATVERLVENAERYAVLASELPARLEGLLEPATAAEPRAMGVQRRRSGSPAVLIALLLALASVALVVPRLAASPSVGPWAVALFLVLGGWCLRLAVRR